MIKKKPQKISKKQNDPLGDFPIIKGAYSLFNSFGQKCESCKNTKLHICFEPKCRQFICFNCTANFQHLGHRYRTLQAFCQWIVKEKQPFNSEQISFLKARAKQGIDLYVSKPTPQNSAIAKKAFKDLEVAVQFPKKLCQIIAQLQDKASKTIIKPQDADLMKKVMNVHGQYLLRMVISTQPGLKFPIIKQKFKHAVFNQIETEAMISTGIVHPGNALYTLNPCSMRKRGWFDDDIPKSFKNISRARFLRCSHRKNCYPIETQDTPYPLPLTQIYASSDLPAYPLKLKKFCLMIHNDKWQVSRNDFIRLIPSGIKQLQIQIHNSNLNQGRPLQLPLQKFEQLRKLSIWIDQWPAHESRKLIKICINLKSLMTLSIIKGDVKKCQYNLVKAPHRQHYRGLINSERSYRRVLTQAHYIWRSMKTPSTQFMMNATDYLNPLKEIKK